MWLDADTIVTNPEIRLESLLPRSTNGPDFVITVDGGGYNAGIWLLRSTPWSYTFLDRWWNMKHYITVLRMRLILPANPLVLYRSCNCLATSHDMRSSRN